MKFLFGFLLGLVAFTNAINLEISATTKNDSDGFVVFKFHPENPPQDSVTLQAQITLPGSENEYSFKDCFSFHYPANSFTPISKTGRYGHTVLSFERFHRFTSQPYTYICPYHAPKTTKMGQVSMYLRFAGVDYFASAPGGTSGNTWFSRSFKAYGGNAYMEAPTRFEIRSIPTYMSNWNLRIGAPADPSVTVAIPVVFENLNPSPVCDLIYKDNDKQVVLSLPASNQNGSIMISMPATTRINDCEIVCPDFIFIYSVSRSAVVEINGGNPGVSSFSWIHVP